MGSLHASNMDANPRFRLVAIADHSEELARGLAYEIGSNVASYDEILGDESIEAVVVASSTSSHLENVLLAVRASKSVFCEKPLSLDAAALAEAMPEIEASSKRVFIAFNRRFDPSLGAMKAQFDGGHIGKLETLHIINHDPALPRLEFIPRSGGLFKDFTIHDFDTASWLVGDEFVEVFAAGACLIDPQIAALGDIDTAKLVLRSANGVLCLISNSRRTGYGYDQRVELFGSKGALRVDNVAGTTASKFDEGGGNGAPFPFSFAERYAEAYRAELDHFADVLDGMAAPSTGPRQALRALRLADAAERSLRAGGPVQLQPGDLS
jgi:myo-inositol 2-dehydrogenase/D-chiro-inositol 1-dehydrogenase